MTNYQYKNNRGKEVGYISKEIYYTKRDYKRGQIFRIYGNGIAIDSKIIEDLEAKKIFKVRVLIINFEKNTFYLEATTKQIRAGEIINYDKRKKGINYTGYGVQYVLPMNSWTRLYNKEQSLLNGFIR